MGGKVAKDAFDYKLEIVVKEWDYIQSHIGRYDTIIFNIRSWAVSAFTAMLAVSASQKLPALMLLAILPMLMFWLIDALHKSFQRHFMRRGGEIESYLASDNFIDDVKSRTGIRIVAPTLSTMFGQGSFSARLKYVLKTALIRNVLVTYAALLFLCLLSYCFLKLVS
jgi:hypothetical protein